MPETVNTISKRRKNIMDFEKDMAETAEKLRRERDHLGVRIHLASMEVRDEWEELEKKWEEFLSGSNHFYREVEPALSDIHAALSLLGEELKAGYKKIKDAL